MNSDERLKRAIETGVPVPGTPQQAAELASYIRCRECNNVGPQGRMSNGALIPICQACKRAADAAEEAKVAVLRQALDAAFAPVVAAVAKLKQKPKPMTPREIIADELAHFAMGYHEDHERTLAFVNRMLKHYAAGTYPEYIDFSDHRCENCNCLTHADQRCEGSLYDRRVDVIDTWVCPVCEMEVDQ